MRPRTYILLILVVLVLAAGAFLVITQTDLLGGGNGGDADTAVSGEDGAPDAAQEGAEPTPEPTAVPQFEEVVVARVDIPLGYRVTPNLLRMETRPVENIALQREEGYVFSDPEDVVGRILRVDVRKGQAILQPMLTLDPKDLVAVGSDLSLYMEQGNVAVSFEINRESGVAYAMRPGDFVDMMMTLRIVEIDPEFRTALPNDTQRVYQPGLLEGQEFLFPSTVQGRLEFIPEINQVAEIIPRQDPIVEGQQFEPGRPIPKRVTQLTIQRAEVLWVGNWRDQDDLVEEAPTPVPVVADGQAPDGAAGEGDGGEGAGAAAETGTAAADGEESIFENNLACVSPANPDQLIPCPVARDPEVEEPDLVILSLTSQEALVLKWAWERGVDIDLALRGQGDNAEFFTTAVSLPQIVNQGGLSVPEESTFDLYPRLEEVDPPPR